VCGVFAGLTFTQSSLVSALTAVSKRALLARSPDPHLSTQRPRIVSRVSRERASERRNRPAESRNFRGSGISSRDIFHPDRSRPRNLSPRLADRFAPRRTQTRVAATRFHPWLHTLLESTILPSPPPLPPAAALERSWSRHSIRAAIVSPGEGATQPEYLRARAQKMDGKEKRGRGEGETERRREKEGDARCRFSCRADRRARLRGRKIRAAA